MFKMNFLQLFCWMILFSSILGVSLDALTAEKKSVLFQFKQNHLKKHNENELKIIKDFLSDVEGLIPEEVKKAIIKKSKKNGISLSLKELQSNSFNKLLKPQNCKAENVVDETKYWDIEKNIFKNFPSKTYLDFSLVNTILSGEKKSTAYSCGHKNTYRLAQALMIGLIMDLYDQTRLRMGDELKNEKNCLMRVTIDDKGKNTYPPGCFSYVEGNGKSVSTSPYFLNLAGWINNNSLIGLRKILNQNILRQLDKREFVDERSTFVVNMEYFLMDPEYGERRPTLYRYFSNLFKHVPFENIDHRKKIDITIANKSFSKNKIENIKLDIKRLYQIDYLFAGKGAQVMSNWGHAMFRLVFCGPKTPMGPNCRLDLGGHVIVSYRAEINDLTMDYSKGINGDYSSKPYLLTFNDVYTEYTKKELRELVSLPLIINQAQKEIFLDRVLEQYWTYEGKYYFFTNNCASESLNLVKTLVNDPIFQNETISTPSGMLDYLNRLKLIDTTVLKDRKKAIANEYYYPPYSETLNKTFGYLSKQGIGDGKGNESYSSSKPGQRYERIKILLDGPVNEDDDNQNEKNKMIINLLRVEEYLYANLESKLLDEISGYLVNEQKKNSKDVEIKKIMDEFKQVYQESLPESRVVPGYGIPLSKDLIELTTEEVETINQKAAKLIVKVQETLGHLFKKTTREIFETSINVEYIKHHLSKTSLKTSLKIISDKGKVGKWNTLDEYIRECSGQQRKEMLAKIRQASIDNNEKVALLSHLYRLEKYRIVDLQLNYLEEYRGTEVNHELIKSNQNDMDSLMLIFSGQTKEEDIQMKKFSITYSDLYETAIIGNRINQELVYYSGLKK